jgi:DNA invertase Pin-like site-specific DNA recombinase
MLTVLGDLVEFERVLIRAHASEGHERAKAQSVKLGRKTKLPIIKRRSAAAIIATRRLRRLAALTT